MMINVVMIFYCPPKLDSVHCHRYYCIYVLTSL